jgi:hypothetical protein
VVEPRSSLSKPPDVLNAISLSLSERERAGVRDFRERVLKEVS